MLRISVESALQLLGADSTPRQIVDVSRAVPQVLKASHALDHVCSRANDCLRESGRLNGYAVKANFDDIAEAKHHLAVLVLASRAVAKMVESAEGQLVDIQARAQDTVAQGSASRSEQPSLEASATLFKQVPKKKV